MLTHAWFGVTLTMPSPLTTTCGALAGWANAAVAPASKPNSAKVEMFICPLSHVRPALNLDYWLPVDAPSSE
jgi:hypothetical protein